VAGTVKALAFSKLRSQTSSLTPISNRETESAFVRLPEGLRRENGNAMRGVETLARWTDPETSKLSAEAVVKSGQFAAHRAIAADLVRRHPGCTSLELSQFGDSPLDRYQIARILRTVARSGLIREGRIRECRVGRRPALTWWPRAEQSEFGFLSPADRNEDVGR